MLPFIGLGETLEYIQDQLFREAFSLSDERLDWDEEVPTYTHLWIY